MTFRRFAAFVALLFAGFGSALGAAPTLSAAAAAAAARGGSVDVLIQPNIRADLTGLTLLRGQSARGGEAMRRLRIAAQASQRELVAWLDARGIEHRDYWLVNAVWARVPAGELAALAARADIATISLDAHVAQSLPAPQAVGAGAKALTAIEWGVAKVHAPEVWSFGDRGAGVVVAGADTGYQWNHPALINAYRGWNGVNASHAYQWHDAIHGSLTGQGNPCGYSTVAPCDDSGHGTHTMGTMVGDDGASNQVGVAPAARWIGCRNMDRGTGAPSTYVECFQWFVAPTDLVGANADPTRAPQVINNSWSCPASEGCDADGTDLIRQAVEATVAAGILVVVSAGNSGPGCGSISDPPPIFAAGFAIAATDSGDGVASFSSRGPITIDGSNRLKPDVAAPGVGVRSSYPPDGYASLSGTSMAGPHAVGVAALLVGARPDLAGDPAALRTLLQNGAVPLVQAQDCGSYPGSQIPNAVTGYGRVDALGTFRAAVGMIFYDGME